MTRAAQILEYLLYRHRYALLGLGGLATVLLLLNGTLSDGRLPYAIRDMLVNYADGPVRRGLFGEVARGLVGLFGGDPAIWAWGMLAVAAALVFVFSIRLFRRLPDNPAMLPLMLAPWSLLFFAYDPEGSLRKELFGYLAITLVLQGALADRALVWVLAGCSLFVAVIFAHEAVVFLWPVLAMAVWVVAQMHPARRASLAGITLAAGGLAALVLIYLGRIPTRDVDVMCAAVQISPCGGPFRWLNASVSDSWAYVYARRGYDELAIYLLQSAVCVVPFLGLRRAGTQTVLRIGLLALPFVAIFPLFLLGYDWGRWIQMAFFPLSLVAVAAIATKTLTYHRVMPAELTVVYVASWSISHAHGTFDFRALWLWPVLAGLIALHALRHRLRG